MISSDILGDGTEGSARSGNSRCVWQKNWHISAGVLTANGLPIAHSAFWRTCHDLGTLQKMVPDWERCFGLRRIIFVGNHGIVRMADLEFLGEQGKGFWSGLRRRRSQQLSVYIRRGQSGTRQRLSSEGKEVRL
ncbi:hypothetical protein [Candidatus Methylacidithermus pantelleriae]|uniref:hypothetical protein n=1 Tax=Candidatus Methylacidithermus pantelleriae TaxID=2744239 RepID=UPI001BD61B9A|nr:hypothetical protein [Candidatus Methylacidithermus pantelleriae]